MASTEAARAAPALAGNDPRKSVHAWRLNSPDNTDLAAKEQDDKPLVGRGGRFYSRAILTAWSPAALAAMDVRWRSTGERVCREVSR